MNILEQLQAALARAQDAHADAVANQGNVAAKLAIAMTTHQEATKTRKRLVAGAASGGEVDQAALESAQKTIAKADSEVQLWTEAQAGAAVVVAQALGPVASAQRAIGDYKFAHAAKCRIDAADALDRGGQEFARLYWAYINTAVAIRAAVDDGHRLDGPQQSNLVRKEVGIRVIPASIASLLANGVFPFPEGQTLGKYERAAFGAWAARAEQPSAKG
jgi:hypothetical protein